jgi:hypothetical protein
MTDNLPPLIISQTDFEQYSASWVQLINQGATATAELNESFTGPSGRLPYLSMPAPWVRDLLSTVGCVMVRVRFLRDANKQFCLGFYATDRQSSRISAYYLLNLETTTLGNLLASMYGQPTAEGDPAVSSGDEGSGSVQIPHGMAGEWIKNWQEVDKLTPDMFGTSYGFLQGYNFQRGDLLDNLFNVESTEQQQLRVDFCLHKYYAKSDSATPTPTYTFGLVLRLVNPIARTTNTPFYDMSTPVPPGY